MQQAREGGKARERSHLLALFPELAACKGGRKPRVQAALGELLTAAGVQLGLNGEAVQVMFRETVNFAHAGPLRELLM